VNTAASPLPAGTRLGPYEIVALVGSGGMAEVYRAQDTRLNRVVAIKLLAANVADTPQRRQRFEREARAISALSHPNICVLYDVGEDQGRPFLVMEFVAGETLAQRLRRGPLPLQEALRLAILVADALDHAHRQGIVHRDLKPANVMLTPGGPKLVDFGLAKLRESEPKATGVTDDTESLTADGMLLGTLPYMAPEQVEAKQADARSDIFAFGSLLYELLTARRAFDADSKAGLIVSILERDPPPLADAAPVRGLAGGGPTVTLLEHMVARCLAKQPDDRWQTAADLKRELRWISERTWPPAARRPRWAIVANVAAVVAVLLLAVAGLMWTRRTDTGASRTAPPTVVFQLPMPAGQMFVSGPAAPQASPSPDGQWVAFAAGTSSVASQIWIWHVRDGSLHALANTNEADYPFWSPDSQSVGFFAHGRLKITRLDDNAPVDLAPAPAPDGGAWSGDGTIVFAPTQTGGLMQVSVRTREERVATRLDETHQELRHAWPCFLPDGRRFVYFVKNTDPALTGIALGRLGAIADRPKMIMPNTQTRAVYAGGSLIFGRELTLFARPFDAEREVLTGDERALVTNVAANSGNGRMAFSASDSILLYRPGDHGGLSPTRLEWRDRRGQVTDTLSDPALYGSISLSPDGRLVLVDRANPSELRLFDHGPQSGQLANGLKSIGTPVWSATGDALVYGLPSTVVRHDMRTGQESTLFRGLPGAFLTGWSPNGRTLLFGVLDPATGWDVWEAPVDGGAPRPYLATAHSEGHAQFSPDGRWIVYVSDESGIKEVWVGTDPASTTRFKISDGGGFMPQWRADGHALYYLDAQSRVIEVDVQLGTTFRAGPSRALFKGDVNQGLAEHYVTQYAVSPDGQRFLFKTPAVPDPPMMVMLNWPSGAPR
jgi:Tol biopolymer transport system component/tRNA A-37 threonylcarbamoyl transferase component Bud32